MKWIKFFEEFQIGDLNFMSPEEIQELFMEECEKRNPDLNLIRVIVENGLVDVNAKDKCSASPLYYTSNIALAKYLISLGADVNVKNDYGITLLHVATDRDNVDLAEVLISAGAKVNAKNDYGIMPLHWAKSVAIAKLLISAGAKVNAKSNLAKSPLYWAVDKDNIALVKYLISVGANVNVKNKFGESLLHIAVDKDNLEIVKLLISAGVDVNAKDFKDTPLARATYRGNKEMETLLKKHGAVE